MLVVFVVVGVAVVVAGVVVVANELLSLSVSNTYNWMDLLDLNYSIILTVSCSCCCCSCSCGRGCRCGRNGALINLNIISVLL